MRRTPTGGCHGPLSGGPYDSPGHTNAARDARIGQILDEVCDRRARGEAVSDGDVLSEHPDLADELRPHLALLKDLRSAHDPLDDLVARGVVTRSADGSCTGQLGPYRIDGLLGRGGMGVVLKAYDDSLNRPVALKVLRTDLIGDDAALARFEREAKAAAALRHPNIVTVYAVGQDRGLPYIAMEYVNGPSLAEVIRKPSAVSLQPSGDPQMSQMGTENSIQRSPDLRSSALSADDRASASSADHPASAQSADTAQEQCHSAAGTRILSRSPAAAESAGPSGEPATDSAEQHGSDRLQESIRVDPRSSAACLSPETIRPIFRQLLEALAAAHHAGLIHRDIKSANILLDLHCSVGPPGAPEPTEPASVSPQPKGEARRHAGTKARSQNVAAGGSPAVLPTGPSPLRSSAPSALPLVKLADFGLARMRSSQTQMTLDGSILGTPEYMSPEQARGDLNIDHRTDLYSAGVVLYEMLTGRTPFHCDTPTATIHRIQHEEPRDPRKLDKNADPVLASLALRLMAKRAEDRLASAGEALKALDGGARVGRPRAVRRGLRRIALVVIVAAAVGGGAWWVNRIVRAGEGLTEVRTVEYKDGGQTRFALEGRYGNKGAWERLTWVLPDYRGGIRAAKLADLDDTGNHKVLVAGPMPPLGEDDVALVAFNTDHTPRWRRSLTPNPNGLWPNCVRREPWRCYALVAEDLDGKAGEELVVVARTSSMEYPARISVVDAASGLIRSTFWHMGHIEGVRVIRNFLDDGRPALVAWGINNKLDGFDDDQRPGFESRRDGDDHPCTDWNSVSVLMILDPAPAKMEGLGPPRTRRLDWLVGEDAPPARPYTYAFLDMPRDVPLGRRQPDSDARNRVEAQDTARIVAIDVLPGRGRGVESACLNVTVERGPERERGDWGGAQLKLDRYLNITNAMTAPGEPASDHWWREYWHVIIRDGQYVDKPEGRSSP